MRPPRRFSPMLAAAVTAALVVPPAPAGAQPAVRPRPIELPLGVPTVIEAGKDDGGVLPFYASYGSTLMAIQPRSGFAQHAKGGFGASLQGYLGLDRFGIAGVRGDASHLIYGSEDFTDTSVANNISSVLVGPQLTIPWGPIRPYVSGGVGLAHLFSTVSYDCAPVNQCETTWNEETEEYETETRKMRAKNHRFTYAWSRRAGVNIALHRFTRSSTRLALDVSVGEHGNGRTQYGIPGEKEKLATGKTRYRVWLVGLSVMNR
jgi:hypothetical protein